MNILVIKQTSLGDVLHAGGHLRAIKQNYPDCRLTLLTATASAAIHRHNPWVDEFILLDLARIKRDWRRRPLATMRHIAAVLRQTRARRFDLAFDLQGLARSVLFLYAARAGHKVVKGNWLGLARFRNPALHAIAEMDGVLARAGLTVGDTSMEIFTAADDRRDIDALLAEINPHDAPLLLLCPFSRWRAKDWPLRHYLDIAARVAAEYSGGICVAFTGDVAARQRLARALPADAQASNLAGRLSLGQFGELVGRAALMLTGDSFPMHVACAQHTPVVALFAPTDERKVGPVGAGNAVIRAPGCAAPGCDRRNCRRYCLGDLSADAVFAALRPRLDATASRPACCATDS